MTIRIPSPQEVGLPEKFAQWRPVQVEMLRFLLTSRKRTKAISAPTGSGKTPVYVGHALLTRRPTCFVTDSRALQDQLMRDFGTIGLVDIRGRRNYECPLKPEYTCEDGYQAGCPYRGTVACPNSQAEMRAATSPLVVTNYDKWTVSRRFGQGMSHFHEVVFDEGHESANALARAMQVVLHHRERERDIGTDPPSSRDDVSAWKWWAVDARAVVELALAAALDRLKKVTQPQSRDVRAALHLRHLYRRLGTLSTCNPANWIVEEIEKGFQFDPIRPGRYAESILLLRLPHVVVISATLRPKTLFLIGQGQDTFDFREFESEFDPRRNPIYWVPTMRVDVRATDLSLLYMRMDQIAAARRDRKGIIHTVSYARRNDLVAHSRFVNSMFINPQGEAPTAMIEQFKAAPDGAILVSPAVGQGHDFQGAACEWQLLCKVPFPPPSRILKARTHDDPEYPYYLAMQRMVQIFGRAMRSQEDQSENFICDDHIEWFLPQYGHLAPQSFHAFFRRVETLPQPPPRLPR